MAVEFDVDISDAMRALDHLDHPPDLGTTLRLEAVLTAQFQATQQYVHVITGSLKASGKLHSGTRDGIWTGEISYGGEAPGSPHDPVRYAELEQSRNPGNPGYYYRRGNIPGTDSQGRVSVNHDFMAPVAAFEPMYREAMMAYLRGEA